MAFDFESLNDRNTSGAQPLDMAEMFRNLEALDAQSRQEELPENVVEYLNDLELTKSGRHMEKQELGGGILRELFFRDNDEIPEQVEKAYDIEEATEEWHMQTEIDSCATACQEFILNEYLDADVQEQQLTAYADSQNWLVEGGTPLENVGNLLEAYGVETNRDWNGTYEELKAALQQGDRAIVGVNNVAMNDFWSLLYPFLTANHAIEVIGLDETDPEDVKVIVNDPGVPDGCGKQVDLDTFLRAWSTSGGYMLVAERP